MVDETPPAKRIKMDFLDTFNVRVGEADAQKIFTVYKDILLPRSRFFKAARSGRWSKDTDQPVDLTDHESETFQHWLYCVHQGCISKLEDSDPNDIFNTLVKLYALADKLQDFETANMVMDEVVRFGAEHDYCPTTDLAAVIYSMTPEQSPLRIFVCDSYLMAPRRVLNEATSRLPRDTLSDMVNYYTAVLGKKKEA